MSQTACIPRLGATETAEHTCPQHGLFAATRKFSRGFSKPDHWSEWSGCTKCDSESRPGRCEKHNTSFTSVRKHWDMGGIPYWEPWSDCPQCEGERERKRQQMVADEEARQRQRRIDELLRCAAIPTRFRTATLSSYQPQTKLQESALAVCREYVANFPANQKAGRCLVFIGKPGTGKTHLACALLTALAEADYWVRYTTVAEVIRSVRDSWNRNATETATKILARLREPALLVLDEVGVQFGTEAELAQLTELIDLRYQDVRPILVVSNCDRTGLEKYLGVRAVDRLRENGGRTLIFDGDSWRGKPAEDATERPA